ncbi:UNVERIFIED_CONTAM: hypothetical protein PYX00_000415 [Menopon gallinae]|uniref:Glutaminyl-peptide cyclotransferase n=1 Tax=Menopon gallinae TaxID=328185 RepID=A0AAW2I8G6_9NEOP
MFSNLNFYIFTILFFILIHKNGSVSWSRGPQENERIPLDFQTLRLSAEMASDDTHFREALDHILIPRVVGTANHTAVFNYITDKLQKLKWDVEVDTFMDRTPFGMKTFRNIIATPNTQAARYLDLACHYDSKMYDNFVFYAATDSAVPCAMLIQLAYSMDTALRNNQNEDIALRLIFFDGEEAFLSWSERDSLYGARHLAKKWAATASRDGTSMLRKIDLLVLLDLLGTPNPKFYNFFQNTLDEYSMIVNVQSQLVHRGLIGSNARYFTKKSTSDQIDDDHVPFLRRGVPVLHIIPVPFPRIWHTEHDTYDAIDFPTVDNLLKILTAFIVDYLVLALDK